MPVYCSLLLSNNVLVYAPFDKMAAIDSPPGGARSGLWTLGEVWCFTWIHQSHDSVYRCEETFIGSICAQYHAMHFSTLVGAIATQKSVSRT
jgi:hypothetical protein